MKRIAIILVVLIIATAGAVVAAISRKEKTERAEKLNAEPPIHTKSDLSAWD